MDKKNLATRKQLLTLIFGGVLIALIMPTLVNCADPAPAKYTVTFNMDGGKPAVKDKIVEAGKFLAKPSPNPTKTGYTFAGWHKDKALTQAFNFATEKITADITLYAKWVSETTTTTYTVAFNTNGGTPNQDDKTVEKGKLLEKPSPDPTKTGYTFEGWHKDQGLTQAFNFATEKITANITLYAKWASETTTTTYTVAFNTNGGAPNQDDKIVEKGKLLEKPSPNPTKTGYTFAGWHKDQGLTQAFNFATEKITANITLYAKWVSETTTTTYTVAFNTNGGTPNQDDKTVEDGKLLEKPSPDPTKTDSTFAGWYKDQGLTQAFNFATEKITANITLYAKWTPESTTTTYTVAFNTNGGTPNQDDKTVEDGKLLEKPSPDPTKTGSTFAGWHKDQGLTQAFDFATEKITANITLYAKWTPESTTTTYTVAFNTNGGTPNQDDKTVEDGKLLEKPSPDPTKTGSTFAGWHKDQGLTQAFDFATEKITANITLYAKWVLATYTVTFNLNGGTPNQDDKTVEDGKLLEKPSPDPTKTGSTFAGWHKDQGLTQAFDFATDRITADITLYAKWTPESTTTTYTVTFNTNGGTPNQDDKTVEENKLLTKPSPDPTKTGYTLEGWYKDQAFTQAFDFATDRITADITLYAKWTLATYTVTFNTNGGVPNQNDETITFNALLTKPSSDPTKKGHTFEGWYKDQAFTQAFDFATERITADTTLYAKWKSYLVGIPGRNFRNKLKLEITTAFVGDSLDPKDSQVTNLKNLDVHGSIIENLAGIEYFTALEELDCNDNRLHSIDLSANTKLKKLFCVANKLTRLDLSGNTKLEWFYCDNNQLDSLDISANTELTILHCISNRLTFLDVSVNRKLTEITCSDNRLTFLDLSAADTVLTSLNCLNNQLDSLDMTGMRSATQLLIQSTSDATNVLKMLKVHENLKDHAQIGAVKTARGDEVTIKTYSAAAGSSSYTLECSNYDPNADDGSGGKGVCKP